MGLLVAGGFIWFPLHMAMVWYLARGAEILAPSDAIDVCVSKHQSALIGGDGDSLVHRRAKRPEDLGHRADERKPLFASANDELLVISKAFCSRREE